MELELVQDWFKIHRAKNPMDPKDPGDICIGWSYAIVSIWKQKKSSEQRIALVKSPREEQLTLTYESTLNDARLTLAMRADCVDGFMMRKRGPNWYYGSDEDQSLELRVMAVEDDDPEQIS
jgi:hypothetical protein